MARLTFLYGILIVVATCPDNHRQPACFRVPNFEFSLRVITTRSSMPPAVTIHDHEIIDLISKYPDGIRLSQLMDAVADRYGKLISFHTSSTLGMDLDGVIRLLEARDKVRIVRGVVYPVASPASVP